MPNKDFEVVQRHNTALRKIYRDIGVAMEVRQEFGGFAQSTGSFSDPVAMDDRGHLDPITSWGFHGGDSIHLSTLATRLLSQVASSSLVDRKWSTYGFIHSVKQNNMGAAKAEDLVYVHSNLRLLSHVEPEYKKGLSRMWDVEPEISDLNLTLNAMTHLNLLEDIVPPLV